jgi:hypothetical protein
MINKYYKFNDIFESLWRNMKEFRVFKNILDILKIYR